MLRPAPSQKEGSIVFLAPFQHTEYLAIFRFTFSRKFRKQKNAQVFMVIYFLDLIQPLDLLNEKEIPALQST